jgi:hypothetical protein
MISQEGTTPACALGHNATAQRNPRLGLRLVAHVWTPGRTVETWSETNKNSPSPTGMKKKGTPAYMYSCVLPSTH